MPILHSSSSTTPDSALAVRRPAPGNFTDVLPSPSQALNLQSDEPAACRALCAMSPGEVANNVFPALPLTMQPGEPAAGVLPTPTQALTMQPGDPGDDIFRHLPHT
ncbi:hypothetical protein A1Q2_03646 [Trichosporon asahii var. asahii CBS 8904]|uniref:Uncharacterized protein n=1 Tax=Trichosporon asahii var. asahii (strain CBS 8904) TaxID=1220162 RepID=K1VRE1_TRIAC|nr:hypothetical protein A1Q2_03646 [Trichosporon asahii var. asahii CBS 8904]